MACLSVTPPNANHFRRSWKPVDALPILAVPTTTLAFWAVCAIHGAIGLFEVRGVFVPIWWGGLWVGSKVFPWCVRDGHTYFGIDCIEFHVYWMAPIFGSLWLAAVTAAVLAMMRLISSCGRIDLIPSKQAS